MLCAFGRGFQMECGCKYYVVLLLLRNYTVDRLLSSACTRSQVCASLRFLDLPYMDSVPDRSGVAVCCCEL
jgi:hypothetical protein